MRRASTRRGVVWLFGVRERVLLLAAAGGALLLFVAGAAGAAAPVLTPAAGSPFPVGTNPHSIASAELNGDSKLDLAVANFGSDTVSILLGDGSGGFAASSSVPVGDAPLGLAAADLDRDGDVDLAVANGDSDNLSILLGDGHGGFSPASGSPIALPNGPWYVGVGYVDKDNRADLVVSHVGFSGTAVPGTHLSILLGKGNGRFAHAPGSPVTVGSVPYGVAVADLDLDGRADLAVANQFSHNVSILLGDGTGRFQAAPGAPIAVGRGPSWVAAADLNHDGKPDLAVANQSSGNVSILLGDGTGGFAQAPGSPVAAGGGSTALRATDLNRDGKLDLAVTNIGSSDVAVLVGDGSGRFSKALGLPVGAFPFSLAAGDFDRDLKPDLAVANYGSNNVTVLLNDTPSPADDVAALRSEVRASGIAVGLRLSLGIRLASAEYALRTGNEPWACRSLASFIDLTRATAGKAGLTETVAQTWISGATAIRSTIGCTD